MTEWAGGQGKVAFVTGASRGIGAESAVRLAEAGYDLAITARTLSEGESHDHGGVASAFRGSLESTAKAIRSFGREALCLRADILDQRSTTDAATQALGHFGRVDLLLNNAVYQGAGNQDRILEIEPEAMAAIYQGNVFTPLALIQTLMPAMIERGAGTVINMVSHAAFHDPPAAPNAGGWGFAYPSSKAAIARLAASIRVEYPDCGIRAFNLEPGTVITETMRSAGIDEAVLARFKPCSPAAIAATIAWLAENDPEPEWNAEAFLRGPMIAKRLGYLDAPSRLSDEA